MSSLLQKSEMVDQLKKTAADVARQYFISDNQLHSLMIAEFKKATEIALSNDTLSEEDEQRLISLQKTLNIKDTDLSGTAERIAKAATLRDVDAGLVRPHIDFPDNPIAMKKGETPLWVFNSVELYEVKTHTQFVGGGQGLSFRIARGVYYRVGGGRGQSVQSQNLEKQDTGGFVVTNQNVYFVGPLKSLRINLGKLVTVQGYADGITLTRESSNPRPLVFKLNDPWFAGNLILKLCLQQEGR